jgi:tetratricopeptide (TPR) repeat protein
MNTETATKYAQDAIDQLTLASRIFKEIIQEKVRYVYALNEIGSCYRALYLLSIYSKASAGKLQEIFDEGVSYYNEAINIAHANNYFVEELDSKQDLAVLYLRAKKHDEARGLLRQIREFIDDGYEFQPGKGLKDYPETDVTDVYYKIMGQVEMLDGAIVFDQAQMVRSVPSRDVVAAAMEHYTLAVAYYSRYSNVSSNTYIMATERIYKRLHDIEKDVVSEIKHKYLPLWIEKYNIPPESVNLLFKDVFEMLGV